MKRLIITLILIAIGIGLSAQWSIDAANPNLIDNTMASQVIPKTAVTTTQDTYFAWFDNTAGNYNVYLQRLNSMGVAQWTAPLLVSNHTAMTWLTEWDITADNDGNCILVFQDIRNVTNNIYAYKISPAGAFLWGADGIALTADTDTNITNMAPICLTRDDNSIVFAWQHMAAKTSIVLQCVNAAGNLLWGQPSVVQFASETVNYTWPQLVAAPDANVLLKYYEDSGPFWAPTRHILVQKLGAGGIAAWAAPTVVQAVGGISAWTQWLPVKSDLDGGMVLAWHEDRNATNISYTYVQHVTNTGSVTMPVNGAAVSTETGFFQFYPKLAYDHIANETYVFWVRENGNQSQWGLNMQKLSNSGNRMWGDTGMAYEQTGDFPIYPIDAGLMSEGACVIYGKSPSAGNDQVENIKAMCFSAAGQDLWAGGTGMIASTGTAKLHYDSAFVGSNWAVVTWEDGGGPSHTNAMRFNADGTLGMALPSPYEFTAEVTGANIHFSWQMPETFAPPVSYKLYQDGVMLIQFPNTGSAYNLDNVPAGTHEYYLTAVWESGESQPSNAISVTIEGSYPPPTNLWWETGDEIYTLVFHWTIPDTPILPTGYRFYSANGDILLFSVNEGAANSVTVPFDQTAMHMYMTAVYSETHESEPSNGITVIVANDDPNVTSVPLQVTASPNPFRNGVNLAFEGVKSSEAVSVVIYNLKGQEVRKWSNLNRNTHQLTWDGLDVAQQPVSSGIYFARITNGKAQQTIKLLKF